MASAICTVDGNATTNGIDYPLAVTPITIALANTAGVNTWALTCIGVDDSEAFPQASVNASIAAGIDTVAKTCLLDGIPGSDSFTFLIRSTVNAGTASESISEFAVHILTPEGLRVVALNEETQAGPHGWEKKVNATIRRRRNGVLRTHYYNDLPAGGGTVTQPVDLASFDVFIQKWTGVQNVKFANPTGEIEGQEFEFYLRNASGGAPVVTWDTMYVLQTGGGPVLTNNHTFVIKFRYIGAVGKLYEVCRSGELASL